jgi:beta-lactamase superfamily II metal-dependent hydrolase
MNRRKFLALAATPLLRGETFEPWTPGTLDIHHLAYGRGNSTFLLCPDGTTILIDAGATEDSLDVSCAQMPDASMRPGQWIASYATRHMKAAGRREIDYFLLTHIHPDHTGDAGPKNPEVAGGYRLTGVMDVDALLPIRKLIDRGFPSYDNPPPLKAPFAANYLAYVKSRASRCERFRPGSANQIKARDIEVRNLAANGQVWTGSGEATRNLFLGPDPSENMCSAAIRITYGNFRYYTGGDLPCDTEGVEPWRDIETPVAEACGPVSVAAANHHAYFDAAGPGFVRALRPKVFIIQAWYVAHPSILPLRRMVNGHDTFVTNLMPANRAVNNQWASRLKSQDGHVVVRVAPGGREFRVLVLDNRDNLDRVQSAHGPYSCG